MTEPCPRCDIRADIGCKHQPPQGIPPPITEPKKDGRKVQRGQGNAFRKHWKKKK